MAERQNYTTLDQIRSDHTERYEYANIICSGDILDAACGVGYGSYIMSSNELITSIDSFDISEDAIRMANKHWKTPKTSFAVADVTKLKLSKTYDWLVSFETIEHIENPEEFLKTASMSCKRILCSVPNETKLPFSKKKFPFHVRHYTVTEIIKLLDDCGFEVEKILFQKKQTASGLVSEEGRTTVLVGKSKNA